MHSADRASVSIGAVVTHYTNRHHRQQHRKRLPDLVVQSSSLDFRDHDLIGVLQQFDTLGGDLSENANRESRTGKGLTLQDLLRHTEIATDAADFVLKKILERLDQFQIHLFRQAADVVMGLDGLRWATHRMRFDYIRIQSSLHQEFGFSCAAPVRSLVLLMSANQLFGLVVEDRDEFVADDL